MFKGKRDQKECSYQQEEKPSLIPFREFLAIGIGICFSEHMFSVVNTDKLNLSLLGYVGVLFTLQIIFAGINLAIVAIEQRRTRLLMVVDDVKVK